MTDRIESSDPPSRGWAHRLPLALILAVAAALRLSRLNRWSLWYDEVVTMRLARSTGPFELFERLGRIDATRAPLHPILLQGWVRAFGPADLSARLSSALFGVLTVAAVYGLGRRAFDERTGRWAAWLCAVCPPLVYYSQEVRMYAWLVLLGVLSWLAFESFRRSAGPALVGVYVLLLAALVYSHPLGLFLIAAHGLAYLVSRRRLVLGSGRWLAAMVAVMALIGPWLPRYTDHSPESILPLYGLKYLFGLPIEYIGGNSLVLVPAAALIVAGLVAIRDRRPRLREPQECGAFVVAWFLVPPLLIYAYSFVGHPIFGPARYHLYVAPAYLLLVARGLAVLPGPARLALAAGALALSAQQLAKQVYAPRTAKVDWRSADRWLDRQGHPGEVAVVVHSADPDFPRVPFEAARYYLEPEAAVYLDLDGLAEGLEVIGVNAPPATFDPGTAVYDAYCFGEGPEAGGTVERFFGVAIRRRGIDPPLPQLPTPNSHSPLESKQGGRQRAERG